MKRRAFSPDFSAVGQIFFVLPCVCVCLRQINSPPFHLPSHPSHNTASGFDISACVCSYVVVPHTCTYITCAAAAFKNEGGPAGQTLAVSSWTAWEWIRGEEEIVCGGQRQV